METFIDFKKIDEQGPQRYQGSIAVSAADIDRSELASIDRVDIDLTARAGDVAGEYDVDGRVDYHAALRCSRCVEPYPFAQSSSFHLIYRPLTARPVTEEEEIEIAQQDLDLEYLDEPRVAVKRIAVEQIQLTLPMKPLCDDSCRGLCTQCGTNLNRSECQCRENLIDDRWEALRGIRDELTKKKEI